MASRRILVPIIAVQAIIVVFILIFGMIHIRNLREAEQNIGYEYGRCVFYDKTPLEICNSVWRNGFNIYEKYYGDGSWTVENDPIP